MTPDEHQRERITTWRLAYNGECAQDPEDRALAAACALAEFDKRFPAPSAAAPVEPDGQFFIPPAELATLRQKARLWDAVASGKLGIYPRDGDFAVHWDIGYSIRPTAAEAVESAIAQGALK